MSHSHSDTLKLLQAGWCRPAARSKHSTGIYSLLCDIASVINCVVGSTCFPILHLQGNSAQPLHCTVRCFATVCECRNDFNMPADASTHARVLRNEVLRSAEAARWWAACGFPRAPGSPQGGPSWPKRYGQPFAFVSVVLRVCKRRRLARGAAARTRHLGRLSRWPRRLPHLCIRPHMDHIR